MKEQWKDITDLKGDYQVSNLGRIKSLARWVGVEGRQGGRRFVKECIRKTHPTREGYLLFTLHRRGFAESVHTLVAKAFVANPDGKPEVNHIDGIKVNCVATNLEWVTSRENIEHAMKMGLIKPRFGEKAPNNKLSASQISEIKALLSAGKMQREIAKQFGVCQQNISRINRHLTWKKHELTKSNVS